MRSCRFGDLGDCAANNGWLASGKDAVQTLGESHVVIVPSWPRPSGLSVSRCHIGMRGCLHFELQMSIDSRSASTAAKWYYDVVLISFSCTGKSTFPYVSILASS